MVQRRKWLPPKPGEYKINFDGAMFNESEEVGSGIVVCDSSGQVLAEKIGKPCNIETLEMLAARRAVNFAMEIGIQHAALL